MIIPIDFFYGRKVLPKYNEIIHYARRIGRSDMLPENFNRSIDIEYWHLPEVYGTPFDPQSMFYGCINYFCRLSKEKAAFVIEQMGRKNQYTSVYHDYVISYTVEFHDMRFYDPLETYDWSQVTVTEADIDFIVANKLIANCKFNSHRTNICAKALKLFKSTGTMDRCRSTMIIGTLRGKWETGIRCTKYLVKNPEIIYEQYVKQIPGSRLSDVALCIKKHTHTWSNERGEISLEEYKELLYSIIYKNKITALTVSFYRILIGNDKRIDKQLRNASGHLYLMIEAVNSGYLRPLNRTIGVLRHLNDDILKKIIGKIYAPFNDNDIDNVRQNEPFLVFR